MQNTLEVVRLEAMNFHEKLKNKGIQCCVGMSVGVIPAYITVMCVKKVDAKKIQKTYHGIEVRAIYTGRFLPA